MLISDIVLNILSFTNRYDLTYNCSLVNKNWNDLTEKMFEIIFVEKYGPIEKFNENKFYVSVFVNEDKIRLDYLSNDNKKYIDIALMNLLNKKNDISVCLSDQINYVLEENEKKLKNIICIEKSIKNINDYKKWNDIIEISINDESIDKTYYCVFILLKFLIKNKEAYIYNILQEKQLFWLEKKLSKIFFNEVFHFGYNIINLYRTDTLQLNKSFIFQSTYENKKFKKILNSAHYIAYKIRIASNGIYKDYDEYYNEIDDTIFLQFDNLKEAEKYISYNISQYMISMGFTRLLEKNSIKLLENKSTEELINKKTYVINTEGNTYSFKTYFGIIRIIL